MLIMGQLFSLEEEELSQVKEAIGSLLYNAMSEGGAVPDLGVAHPLLLANHSESLDSRTRLQQQLQQVNTFKRRRVGVTDDDSVCQHNTGDKYGAEQHQFAP